MSSTVVCGFCATSTQSYDLAELRKCSKGGRGAAWSSLNSNKQSVVLMDSMRISPMLFVYFVTMSGLVEPEHWVGSGSAPRRDRQREGDTVRRFTPRESRQGGGAAWPMCLNPQLAPSQTTHLDKEKKKFTSEKKG